MFNDLMKVAQINQLINLLTNLFQICNDWIRFCRRIDLFIVYCIWYSTHDGRKAQIFFESRRICFRSFEPLLGCYQPFPLHPYDRWSVQRRLNGKERSILICVRIMKSEENENISLSLMWKNSLAQKKSNVNMFIGWMIF